MRRTRIPLSTALVLLLSGVGAPVGADEANPEMENAAAEEPSLYARLGGYDALAAVTDDFIARLAADESLQRFFVGHSTDSLAQIRQLIVDQLCEATGGPCVYTGRTMEASHGGLHITETDWQAAAGHLVATLDKLEVPEKEKGEVLALVTSLHDSIVEE